MKTIPDIYKKVNAANIKFYDKPLNMDLLLEHADLLITHAGHGMVAAALTVGKPLLLLYPKNGIERFIVATNVEKIGAGLTLDNPNPSDIAFKLDLLLHDGFYRTNAEKFALSYKDHNQVYSPERFVRLVERL